MSSSSTPLEYLVAFALAFAAGVVQQYILSRYLESLRRSMPSTQ